MARSVNRAKNSVDERDVVDNISDILKFKGNIVGDFRLDPQEKKFLELARGLWKKQPDYEVYYYECRDAIINYLIEHDYNPRVPKDDGTGTITAKAQGGMDKIPYVIKLLLWCMAYRAHELYEEYEKKVKEGERKANKTIKKPTDQAILSMIERNSNDEDKNISRKTFTYFGISPSRMFEINHYKQIYLPVTYAGAKNGYLGYALRYLTEFAGVYDNYVDIFGGSGYAYLALNHKNYVSYYINEYNFFIVNYYNVIKSDELFPLFMERFKDLQKYLRECEYDKLEGKEIFRRCKKIADTWKLYMDFETNSSAISNNAAFYMTERVLTKVDAALAFVFCSSFSGQGNKNEEGNVKESTLKRLATTDWDFNEAHERFKRIDRIFNSDALGSNAFIIGEFKDKASALYADYDDIIRALRVTKSLSKVNNAPKKDSEEFKTIEDKVRRLGYSEDKKSPRPYTTLYYSDSPYLQTVGYKVNKDSTIGEITVDTMHTLIDRLIDATTGEYRGNHFIFSCRASVNMDNGLHEKVRAVWRNFDWLHERRDKYGNIEAIADNFELDDTPYSAKFGQKIAKADDVLKAILTTFKNNQIIYENVFLYFKNKVNKDKKLYVLCCISKHVNKALDDDEDALGYALRTLEIVEVFITDFDFVPPLDYEGGVKKAEKYTFRKYTLEEFCEILKIYMLHSALVDDLIVERNGNICRVKKK